MSSDTEHTCAIFFKVTGDQALKAVAGDLDHVMMMVRSKLTEAVEMNGTRDAKETRYADPDKKIKRVPFADARARVKVLPELKVLRKGQWEDA